MGPVAAWPVIPCLCFAGSVSCREPRIGGEASAQSTFAIDKCVMEQAFSPTMAEPTGALHGAGLTVGPSTVSSFLGGVEEVQHSTSDAQLYQSKLAQRRLGMAASLFTALRVKHPPSAAHSLRVALGVSSWSLALDFGNEQRELLEVAALLHDIGKLGVPDHVLVKPGRLCGEEVLMMERHSHIGREILSGCCVSDDLLDIIYYSTAWYDGSKHGFDRSRDQLPLGSRMIAIVDAFDAMTTDHVYRRAMSRERAGRAVRVCRDAVRRGTGKRIRSTGDREPAAFPGPGDPPLAASDPSRGVGRTVGLSSAGAW